MSKSRTYVSKKSELQAKEQRLLDELNVSGKKWKNLLMWALGAGLVSLVFWGIYRSLYPVDEGRKKKKRKRKKAPLTARTEVTPFLESVIAQVAPRVGEWILKEFKPKRK